MNREALFQISYGLYVITSRKKNGDQNGFIGNTAFQITSEPPQIALGVSCNNYTYEFIRESALFAVSVLSRSINPEIIRIFGYNSGRDIDKFAGVKWIPGNSGAPLITEGVNATFECNVVKEINLKTHVIFIGEVSTSDVVLKEASPLTYKYYREEMKGKAPKNAPTYVEEESVDSDNGGEKYVCGVCGFEYNSKTGDPKNKIPPGTSFSELPENWTCPVCGSPLDVFSPKN